MSTNTNAITSTNVVEAYKTVTEFNKTIISVTSAIVAALIIYFITNDYFDKKYNYLPIGILVLSIFFSFLGFGQSIKPIKTGLSNRKAIVFSNLGGYSAIAGLISLIFIQTSNDKNVDEVLSKVNTSMNITKDLNIYSLQLENDNYTLKYNYKDSILTVIYSLNEGKISDIKYPSKKAKS